VALFELANEIAVLSGGRRAEWTALPAVEGAPTTANDGVALLGALKTLVVFDVREDVGARRGRITIATLTFTNTYRVTINGNDADFDATASSTLQEVLDGIANEINTTTGVKNVVTATVIDDDEDGTDDTVLIVGKSENDYTIDHSVAGDTPPNNGDLKIVADPVIGSIRIYAAAGGLVPSRPDSWRIIRDGEIIDIDFRGFVDRLDTASLDRIHIEAFDVQKDGGDGAEVIARLPDITIGPSTLP
jgi:hypothetical protein